MYVYTSCFVGLRWFSDILCCAKIPIMKILTFSIVVKSVTFLHASPSSVYDCPYIHYYYRYYYQYRSYCSTLNILITNAITDVASAINGNIGGFHLSPLFTSYHLLYPVFTPFQEERKKTMLSYPDCTLEKGVFYLLHKLKYFTYYCKIIQENTERSITVCPIKQHIIFPWIPYLIL